MKFTCSACTRTEQHASFSDANRFAYWSHVGTSLICGVCYLARLACKNLTLVCQPVEDDRPTPEDLVSNADCPYCNSPAFSNPETCQRCAEEWQNAAELARKHHERFDNAAT